MSRTDGKFPVEFQTADELFPYANRIRPPSEFLKDTSKTPELDRDVLASFVYKFLTSMYEKLGKEAIDAFNSYNIWLETHDPQSISISIKNCERLFGKEQWRIVWKQITSDMSALIDTLGGLSPDKLETIATLLSDVNQNNVTANADQRQKQLVKNIRGNSLLLLNRSRYADTKYSTEDTKLLFEALQNFLNNLQQQNEAREQRNANRIRNL